MVSTQLEVPRPRMDQNIYIHSDVFSCACVVSSRLTLLFVRSDTNIRYITLSNGCPGTFRITAYFVSAF